MFTALEYASNSTSCRIQMIDVCVRVVTSTMWPFVVGLQGGSARLEIPLRPDCVSSSGLRNLCATSMFTRYRQTKGYIVSLETGVRNTPHTHWFIINTLIQHVMFFHDCTFTGKDSYVDVYSGHVLSYPIIMTRNFMLCRHVPLTNQDAADEKRLRNAGKLEYFVLRGMK